MDVPALLWLIAKVTLLVGGLLIPGAALMRALDVPRTVATCFAGSALSIYAMVLGLQFASIRISLGSLTAGLFIITATALVVARLLLRNSRFPWDRGPLARTSNAGETPALPGRCFFPSKPTLVFSHMGVWTPLYALFWAAVLWRAWHEPLAGPDIEFRWSFLAEQMLRLGSLDFFPPRSTSDFFSYFWVESIPPGASALHAWAYACAGGSIAAWTVPAVVLQLWSLHELLWRIAERIGGAVAARFTLRCGRVPAAHVVGSNRTGDRLDRPCR